MLRVSRFGAAVLLACAFCASAATVKKADDTTVTGPLVALESGAVVLNVDVNGKPQRTAIPLEDVVELTVDASADVPKDPPPDAKAPQSQAATAPAAAPKGPEMTAIFDGKTLKGWEGKEGVWTVADGVLTGKVGEDARSNRPTYLIYTAEEFGDFELHYKFKITGGRPNSSGVQFRSRVLQQGDAKDLSGYQQDLGVPAGMTGGIVDNAANAGGQPLKAQPGERVVYTSDKQRQVTPLDKPVEQLNALLKENDWNEAIIVAKGQRLLSIINGEIFAAATNETGSGVTSGVLGIQLSTRVDMTVQFKDMRIRKLAPKDKPNVAGHPWDQPSGTATAAATEKAGDKPAASGAPAAPANPDAVATADAWQVRPVGGESIRGELLGWDEQHLRLKTAFGELTIPVKQLSEVWHASSDDIRKARAAMRSETPAKPGQVTEDVAFARKDDQVIPVSGLVLGVEPGGTLKFRFRDQERKILPDKLVGVILASALDENAPAAPGDDALRQVLVLQGGDVVSGQWTAFEKGAVTLATRWGTRMIVPIKQIERVQTKNGRLTYVSDLTPAHVEQTPYFDRLLPFKSDVSLAGQPIKLADGQHAKGISVHSRTVLRYDIGRRFERFRAKVGFQQPEGKNGRATIRVLGDNDKVLHEIADARGDQPPADLDVPVAGVSRLTLEVDFGADQDVGDRVAWANARLIRAAAAPAAAPVR